MIEAINLLPVVARGSAKSANASSRSPPQRPIHHGHRLVFVFAVLGLLYLLAHAS